MLFSSQTGSENTDFFQMTSDAMWSVQTFRPDLGEIEPHRDRAATICKLIGLKD